MDHRVRTRVHLGAVGARRPAGMPGRLTPPPEAEAEPKMGYSLPGIWRGQLALMPRAPTLLAQGCRAPRGHLHPLGLRCPKPPRNGAHPRRGGSRMGQRSVTPGSVLVAGVLPHHNDLHFSRGREQNQIHHPRPVLRSIRRAGKGEREDELVELLLVEAQGTGKWSVRPGLDHGLRRLRKRLSCPSCPPRSRNGSGRSGCGG